MPDVRDDPDALVGRRYTTSFVVVSIGAAPRVEDRPVVIRMRGALYSISLGELATLIEREFVAEESV